MNLSDKLFLITGASSGIGAATARAAAPHGARLILLARSAQKLDQLSEEITHNGGVAFPFAVDLTDSAAVQSLAEKILRQVGTPDILLNNAGSGRWLSITETNSAEAVEMMAAPYFAAFFTTRSFLPAMLAQNRGTIANMTSAVSRMACSGATAYISARWAMRGFTEALRADLYRTRLHVMLITFAKVQSSYFSNNPGTEDRIPRVQTLIPVLSPEAAAAAILAGIQHRRHEVIAPFMLNFILMLNVLFPGITRFILNTTGWKGNLPKVNFN